MADSILRATGTTQPDLRCPSCWDWTVACTIGDPRHNATVNTSRIDGHVDTVRYQELSSNKNDVFGHSNL